MTPPLNPTDQLFLWLEKRQQPMHVGGLQLFSFPPEARRTTMSRSWQTSFGRRRR